MYILYNKSDGLILGTQSTSAETMELATLPLDESQPLDLSMWFIVDGEITQRPTRPTITTTGIAPHVIDVVTPYTLTVTNEAGDSATVVGEPIQLEDAGTYQISVTAPFPAHTFTAIVEVTNA